MAQDSDIPVPARALVTWLRDRMTQAGARGFAVGLSGGVDSAVVSRLCQLAAPDDTLGLVMPCHSDPRDEADALLVATHFSLPVIVVDLASAFDALRVAVERAAGVTGDERAGIPADDDIRARVPIANIKPRLRMAALYYVANQRNYLVAGTGNRSEVTIGYFTKYGDGGVDVLPIGHLLKREVRAFARELDVPAAIVDKAPSAGLWLGQTDEHEIGFTYAMLDSYVEDGPDTIAPAVALTIERLIRSSEHKRSLPPMPER